MKNDRKTAGKQQTYLSKNTQEMINRLQQPEMKTEARADDTTHDEERYSEIEDKPFVKSDVAEHAQRLAVNYVRSLLLF